MTDKPTTSTPAPKRFLLFDSTASKITPGPKRTAPQSVLKRAGGLTGQYLKYSDFLPLYELWCGYFDKICESMNPATDERMLKTDWHGCILMVVDSPNPAQIGVTGICLHESLATFQLLTRKDRVAVVQKEHTTFQFVFKGRIFTLFGDGLRARPSLRGRKCKARLTLPFLLPTRT